MFSKLINTIFHKNIEYCVELNKINGYIDSFLSKTTVPQDVCQIILNSGKRIRSLLALNIYYNYYATIPENLLRILALVELIHFGSLLHDDVIDNNNVRRGKCSIYKAYGSKKSILLGDYLLIKIFEEITKLQTGQYVVDAFIKVASNTAYGAWIEQNLKHKCSFGEYIKMVSLKTSSLFSFASTVGIRNMKNVSKIGIYATCFGIVYQVQNDLDSYNTEDFQSSEDYMEGNVSYPVVALFKTYPRLFTNKNQENFLHIRNIMKSEEFKQRAFADLSKYLKRLTDTDVYIK